MSGKLYAMPGVIHALKFDKDTTEVELKEFSQRINVGKTARGGPEWVAVPTPGGFHQMSFGNYIVRRPDAQDFEVIPERAFEAFFEEA